MKVIHNQGKSYRQDPLRELLVEVVEVDRNKLAEVLKGYIRINSKDGRIIPQESFSELDIRNKILTFLIGRKVSSMLEYEYSEVVSKDEIKFATGIMRGMLTPELIELKTEELISRSKAEGYFVSDKQLLYVVQELEKASRKRNYLNNRLK